MITSSNKTKKKIMIYSLKKTKKIFWTKFFSWFIRTIKKSNYMTKANLIFNDILVFFFILASFDIFFDNAWNYDDQELIYQLNSMVFIFFKTIIWIIYIFLDFYPKKRSSKNLQEWYIINGTQRNELYFSSLLRNNTT